MYVVRLSESLLMEHSDIVKERGLVIVQVARGDADPVPYLIHEALLTRYSQRIARIVKEWQADHGDGPYSVSNAPVYSCGQYL